MNTMPTLHSPLHRTTARPATSPRVHGALLLLGALGLLAATSLALIDAVASPHGWPFGLAAAVSFGLSLAALSAGLTRLQAGA